jgi:hypothetical protein
MALINSRILDSYYSTIQGGVVAGFINFTTNQFQATKTTVEEYGDNTVPAIPLFPAAALVIDPIDFQTEVDPGVNFNLGTDEYTAPVNGFYTFNIFAHFSVYGYQSGNVVIGRWGFNVNGTQTFVSFSNYVDGIYNEVYTLNVSLQAGDTVTAIVSLRSNGVFNAAIHQRFKILSGTRFNCTSSPDTGGIVAEYDAADLRNILLEFDYPISATDFQTLLQNTRSKFQIALSVLNENYYGWIEQLNYNHKTSEAKIILKASINSIGGTLVNGELIYGYRFSFDMTDAADQIDSFTYNSGGSTTACAAIDLNDTIINITDLIEACLGASGITFDSVTVTKTQLVGALYSFIITIFNPSIDITIITISGTDYDSVVTYA